MRHMLLPAFLFVLFVHTASAQDDVPPPPSPHSIGKSIVITDAAAHIGELVNLCDTIYVYPQATDKLTLFCLGGRYPNQLLTVAVKDQKAVFSVDNYISKPMCVTGTIILKNKKPVLLITGPEAMMLFSNPKSQ